MSRKGKSTPTTGAPIATTTTTTPQQNPIPSQQIPTTMPPQQQQQQQQLPEPTHQWSMDTLPERLLQLIKTSGIPENQLITAFSADPELNLELNHIVSLPSQIHMESEQLSAKRKERQMCDLSLQGLENGVQSQSIQSKALKERELSLQREKLALTESEKVLIDAENGVGCGREAYNRQEQLLEQKTKLYEDGVKTLGAERAAVDQSIQELKQLTAKLSILKLECGTAKKSEADLKQQIEGLDKEYKAVIEDSDKSVTDFLSQCTVSQQCCQQRKDAETAIFNLQTQMLQRRGDDFNNKQNDIVSKRDGELAEATNVKLGLDKRQTDAKTKSDELKKKEDVIAAELKKASTTVAELDKSIAAAKKTNEQKTDEWKKEFPPAAEVPPTPAPTSPQA